MSKSYKTWTGIFAVLPFLMLLVYIYTLVAFMLRMAELQGRYSNPDWTDFVVLISVGLLMAVTGMAALIFYLLHAVRNKTLEDTERLMWILIFIFASVIAFPIYWYMKILKEPNDLSGNQDLSSHTFTR